MMDAILVNTMKYLSTIWPSAIAAWLILLSWPAQGGEIAALPLTWLERMGQVGQRYRYEGVLVYRRADQIYTLRLTQRLGADGQPMEQLQALDGEMAQEVTLTERQVNCRLARAHISQDRPGQRTLLWTGAGKDWARVERHYLLELGALERIAGREARVIRVVPKDSARYGQIFWLDQETAFPLRSDLLDAHHRLLSQWLFTALTLEPSPPAQPELQAAAAPEVAQYRLKLLQQEPLGFAVILRQMNLAEAQRPVEHWLLSDGMARVSVYLEQASQPAQHWEGMATRPPVHAYGRNLGAYHLTVVGEVPAETVQYLAKQFVETGN